MDAESTADYVSEYVLDAPPGELNEVLNDIRKLVSDSPAVLSKLQPALERYNKEQLTAVKLPGVQKAVLISEHNELPGGRFFDVEVGKSWGYDHTKQTAIDVQPYTLDSGNSSLITSLHRDLSHYVKEHYPASPVSGVFPSTTASNSGTITLAISGSKYSPGNFWNGRWRSVYTFSSTSSPPTLCGTISVDVHYYEDGNVRLQTHKETDEITLRQGASSQDVLRAIAAVEKRYQEELNRAFGSLSEGAYKNLRRQLPITRQKIDWAKIGTYRLGQDIGGGRSLGK